MDKDKTVSIEPWITLDNAEQGVRFYTTAFNAIETYRLENPNGGLVARLSVNGAGFWISSEENGDNNTTGRSGKDSSVRLILIVNDSDSLFAQAIKAGATEVFPVGEGHGWRLGRLSDPFGLHWEIGHQIS